MQKNYNSTAYREELRPQILIAAMALFKKHGVKAVKMDDIAAEMGISKRTLYELYSNKEDLLYECVKNDQEQFIKNIIEYAETAHNEMETMTYFVKLKLDDLGSTNPVFFADLHKYTRIIDFLRDSKKCQRTHGREFIRRGIEQGYFRSDMNYDILNLLGDAAMNNVMQTQMYLVYPLRDIFRTFMIIFMRTCCTETGLKYMQKMLAGE